MNKNVGEITENFEILRGDKSYIQNAIATVQGALKKKIKKKTIGHDPGSRNPNRFRSQHILYAGRKVDWQVAWEKSTAKSKIGKLLKGRISSSDRPVYSVNREQKYL